ncbi:MAG: cytochrome b/b6 domain-containing protein [Gemmataceae bacterium]
MSASLTERQTEAGGVTPPATVKVWDLFIRVFHWSLVLLLPTAYLTGNKIEWLHLAAGYAIAVLIALRIGWGIVGARHARFSNFVRSPGAVLAYLWDIARHRAPRHLGHNPAGGAMVLALLALLAATGVTGYMMTTDAFWGAQWVEDVHQTLANLTIVLIVVHVLGVLAASVQHGENLVRSMITGRKRER